MHDERYLKINNTERTLYHCTGYSIIRNICITNNFFFFVVAILRDQLIIGLKIVFKKAYEILVLYSILIVIRPIESACVLLTSFTTYCVWIKHQLSSPLLAC